MQHPVTRNSEVRTSFLFLHGQLLPVSLHAVPKRHPQIGLLLRGHILPSLLNVGERRVGDGVCLAGLLKLASYRGSSGESCACRGGRNDDSRAPRSAGDRRAKHGGGWSGECRKMQKKGGKFPSRDLEVPMDRGGDGVEGGPGELSCKMRFARGTPRWWNDHFAVARAPHRPMRVSVLAFRATCPSFAIYHCNGFCAS